jgi:hypothetical protein
MAASSKRQAADFRVMVALFSGFASVLAVSRSYATAVPRVMKIILSG